MGSGACAASHISSGCRLFPEASGRPSAFHGAQHCEVLWGFTWYHMAQHSDPLSVLGECKEPSSVVVLTSQDHVLQPLSTYMVTAARRQAGAWHSFGRVPGCPEPTPWQEWLSWCFLLGHRSSWLDALQPLAQPCQHLATVTEEKHIPLPPDGISCFIFLLKWCPLPPMRAGTAEQSLAPLLSHLKPSWRAAGLRSSSPPSNGLVPSPA